MNQNENCGNCHKKDKKTCPHPNMVKGSWCSHWQSIQPEPAKEPEYGKYTKYIDGHACPDWIKKAHDMAEAGQIGKSQSEMVLWAALQSALSECQPDPAKNIIRDDNGDLQELSLSGVTVPEPAKEPENVSYTGKDETPMIKLPMVKCPCCNGTGLRPACTDLYGKKIEVKSE